VFVGGTGYVKGPRGAASQRLEAHLKYMRHRAGGEGEGPRTVFGETDETLSLREAHQMILDQGRDGLRFHKIVISPAADERVADWQAFARRVMDDLGRRLGLKLTWCATVHQNTDHPHVHIVLAGDGERADGQVVQARLYTPHYEYLRERAQWHTEQAWDSIGEELRHQEFVARREDVPLRSVGATYAAWTRYSEEKRDPASVQQANNASCLSATGEMVVVAWNLPEAAGAQASLIEELGSPPIQPKDLRDALTRRYGPQNGVTWHGGYAEFANPQAAFAQINEHLPWIAVVRGIGRDHAVMIDGIDTEGRVMVRDPWGVGQGTRYVRDPSGYGSSYVVPWDEFQAHWIGAIWGQPKL